MKEVLSLKERFGEVVADLANGYASDMDSPCSRKAYATHQHLMENDAEYRALFEKYKAVGETTAAERLHEDFLRAVDRGGMKQNLALAWMCVRHFPTLFSIRRCEQGAYTAGGALSC
jgi:hypothetical protein